MDRDIGSRDRKLLGCLSQRGFFQGFTVFATAAWKGNLPGMIAKIGAAQG
jgi:hypothetical protein